MNRTPRIHTDTIDLLLLWALRFVEGFADDIIAAFAEHLRLRSHGSTAPASIRTPRREAKDVQPELCAYLNRLSAAGGGALPGRRHGDGTLVVDWAHLTRLFSSSDRAVERVPQLRRLIDSCGLPIADAAYLETPTTAQIDDAPWHTRPISYREAPRLAALLRTACFIAVAYLSGMRCGEVLNLERGCVSHDQTTGLWLISGRRFKGARDEQGNKIAEGEQRRDPWVVAEQAAHAVMVLQRLHDQRLLFPGKLQSVGRHCGGSGRIGQARDPSGLTRDITAFIARANNHARELSRKHEHIPDDPIAAISPSRFRRTLAWHIVRRPRGFIAGSIQYGHVHVQMTVGYGGSYDSGFPDEHAFEQWLFRLERLTDDHQFLLDGEQVSGPAADLYRQRVDAGHEQFAGRVLTNIRQARDLVANPLLQVYPGRAMTCVFDPAKAQCQQHRAQGDSRTTPDLDDCRTTCQNIAYTDRDIRQLRQRAARLHDLLGDFLAPSPRHQRIRAERDRLAMLIRDHERDQQ